jgi:hypothetical protein
MPPARRMPAAPSPVTRPLFRSTISLVGELEKVENITEITRLL